MKPILLVDNYDSFTYNLLHYLEAEGNRGIVVRQNDDLAEVNPKDYEAIVISPGPGLPIESNGLLAFIDRIKYSEKIFGICLGLQAIAVSFGMQLKNLEEVVHGLSKNISILDEKDSVFNGIPKDSKVGRYHSWVIDRGSFNSEFTITAVDEGNEIMAIRHNSLPIHAVQFHPESILSEFGKRMVKNWLDNL